MTLGRLLFNDRISATASNLSSLRSGLKTTSSQGTPYSPIPRISASARALASGVMCMGRPHSRCVSPGHLLVASIPILLPKCRIPDDCIDSKRYPLFIARAVLEELIESLQSIQGVKPC